MGELDIPRVLGGNGELKGLFHTPSSALGSPLRKGVWFKQEQEALTATDWDPNPTCPTF